MCVLCMNCWNLNRKPNLFFLHSHSRSDTDPVRLHLFIVIYNKCVKLFVNTTCVCEMLCLSLGVWGQVWRCVKSHFLNISCVAAVLFLGGSLIFFPPTALGNSSILPSSILLPPHPLNSHIPSPSTHFVSQALTVFCCNPHSCLMSSYHSET